MVVKDTSNSLDAKVKLSGHLKAETLNHYDVIDFHAGRLM